MRKTCTFTPHLIFVFILLARTLSAQTYGLLDLSSLSGGSTVAHKVNLSGHVASTSGARDGGSGRAAIWTGNKGQLSSLGARKGGDYSEANGINNRDDVVGSSNTDVNVRAVLWSNRQSKDLGALPGDTASRAFGINDQLQIVGYSSGPSGVRAFLWTPKMGMTPLPLLRGTKSSEAYGINNRGQVVGILKTRQGDHGFMWAPDKGLVELGNLPGDQTNRAMGINDSGEVVGSSAGPSGTRAYIWTLTKGITALPDVPRLGFSEALDINNRGQIVGTYETPLGNRACLWTNPAAFFDLNDLVPTGSGVVLTMALGINDQGQIIAIGVNSPTTDANHQMDQDEADDAHGADIHAFLLTPR